ncbi:uncharacterized protein LOC111717732 [Eurytemora carolleeae]|uniref:uncharacterized protein LOC111717732 n=1 Tax=Eurytemora carolleeae TaxID=1294199 RepID=UPI000C7650D4|nr:uncharacterized protein LOC111717732 [Eurytemora carolleeae]|eukprot:XP_023348973.1 uncharacterized protein LOC111717732 [Eurytemora affinis]
MKRNRGRTVQPQPEDLSSRSLRDRGRSLRDRARSLKEDRRSPPEVRRSMREGERYMRFRNQGEKEEEEEMDEDGGQDEEDRGQEEDERGRDDEERGREENLIHILGRLRGRSHDMQGACDWCFRVSTPQFSLPVSDGEELKLFCSESCFSHYRRAVFKVGRAGAGNVCDNCKQVRQDTLVVQDNTRKMYFCSTTCLNLYREGISSSSENLERATERPTVKVKPDHILKKPELKNREIENRRYKCIGGNVNGIRKTAVRDRQQRRVPADQRLGVVPHIQLAGSNRPQVFFNN